MTTTNVPLVDVPPDEPLQVADGAAPGFVILPEDFRLGVWIDVGRRIRDHFADHSRRLEELGFNDVAVMLNVAAGDEFTRSSMSDLTLDMLTPLLRKLSIPLTLTSWLIPEKRYIDAVLEEIPDVAREYGARAIEFDAEESWYGGTPTDFLDHQEAADYLFDNLRSLLADGVEVGVTPQVNSLGDERIRTLVRRADFIVPQAYQPGIRPVGNTYGPVGLQQHAATLYSGAGAGSSTEFLMGLAAYDRHSWLPDHGVVEIMTLELEETLALASSFAIRGVRYWSWAAIVGREGTRNEDEATFFRSLKAGTLASIPLP